MNYAYDNANRLTQITQSTSTVSFAYDNADRRTSLTLPNGVVTQYSYDADSRLTSLTYTKGGATLGNLTYLYDAAGRRASVGGSFARTGLPSALNTASYNAGNQQTAFGSQTLAFDLNGNLTNDGTNAYVWNTRDQLVSISGSVTASFQYDAVGRRRSKTIGGTQTSFLYDRDNVVQEQSSGTANMLAGSLDEYFGRSESSGTSSPITDALGSAIALTDSSGVVETEYTYEPFGSTSVSGISTSNPAQYTGRENDGTGLYYYRARYYSPSFHRFISKDPIEFQGGDINLYAYVGNSPTIFSDAFGLQHPYEQITHNASKMGAPPLGGRNCANSGSRDARLIFDTYRKSVDLMTEKGLRHPFGPWNDFSSYWKNYLGCGHQTDHVTFDLKRNKYDANWTFETESRLLPFPHQWGKASSNNPDDPVIIYDPWNDVITCEKRK